MVHANQTTPADIHIMLATIGVNALGNPNWKKLGPACEQTGTGRAYRCGCGEGIDVLLKPVMLRKRKRLAGQCEKCKTIYWREVE